MPRFYKPYRVERFSKKRRAVLIAEKPEKRHAILAAYAIKRKQWQLEMELLRGRTKPRTQKEALFCRIFADMVCALPHIGVVTLSKEKLVEEIGVTALKAAGYTMGRRNKNGVAIAHKSDELLGLPRVQRAIAERMSENGVTVDKAAKVMGEILDATLGRVVKVTKDEEGNVLETETEGVSASDKLNAIKMFFSITTGFAPTKSANVHAHVKGDTFFEPEVFKNPGDPELTFDQEA